MSQFNLRMRVTDGSNEVINAIKEIRSIFNVGLKEAKDIVDASKEPEGHNFTVNFSVNPEEFRKAKHSLLTYGYKLSDGLSNEFVNHREVLKVIVVDAVQAERLDIAKDVLALIDKHF